MSTLILAAIVPGVLLLVRRRAATVMLATIAATWPLATLAVFIIPDDIATFILMVLFALPAIVVGTSIWVSVTLAPQPRKVFDAGFLAMCGWWIGFVFMLLWPSNDPGGLWGCAMFVVYPSIFAASGAAFGATNRSIS